MGFSKSSSSRVAVEPEDHLVIALLPRRKNQGYHPEDLEHRRRWLEQRTGASLTKVGESTLDSESMRGNVENPIGAAQVPLRVNGEYASGIYYVPLAGTEGALVRSYEGASALRWLPETPS